MHNASDSGVLRDALKSILYLAKRPGALGQLKTCVSGLDEGPSEEPDDYDDEDEGMPPESSMPHSAAPKKKSLSILLGIPKFAPKKAK